jgi:hypothetical protein
VLYSRQGTVEKVVKKIGELGEQGVRFATFPETFVPYWFISLAQMISNPWSPPKIAVEKALARKKATALMIGFFG